MGHSLIHEEMLMGPILCKSCEDEDGYSEFMSAMAGMSRRHLFVACLPMLLHTFLPFFRDIACALKDVSITSVSAESHSSTITYSQHFGQLWISVLANVCCSKEHSLLSSLCLGQVAITKLSKHTQKKNLFFFSHEN